MAHGARSGKPGVFGEFAVQRPTAQHRLQQGLCQSGSLFSMYPTDMSDDEWVFVAPYLLLITEKTPQGKVRIVDLIQRVNMMALMQEG